MNKKLSESDNYGSAARQMLNRSVFTAPPARDTQVFKMHSKDPIGSDGVDCECPNPDCPCRKKGKS